MASSDLGVFTYRDKVAVVQVSFFTVYLGCGILLCSRHGWSRNSGWLILITFSLLRILAGSFQLATINHPSTATYGGALICQSIGLSPLTVLNVGLLARVNRFVVRGISSKVFSLISLASLTGVGLGIYGGTKAAESADHITSNAMVKVAVCIFLGIYAFAVCLWGYLLKQWRYIPGEETKLMLCFAACAPFIAVRLLYALIADFSGMKEFNPFEGDVSLFLCMAVLEEIIAVALCVITGLRLRKLPKDGDASSDTSSDRETALPVTEVGKF
ncbi:hypothetical protein VP1G_08286 [Cytospora mali]|uniref:DUF7702 domain-containing protein n=1 Tax=Cytospora mali TaxID=578113 RepID=A0A194VB53_CYTMA|nr:hypothetical protein VP1G_08286 [Valsa mali var. pyri (nom. inval.)]